MQIDQQQQSASTQEKEAECLKVKEEVQLIIFPQKFLNPLLTFRMNGVTKNNQLNSRIFIFMQIQDIFKVTILQKLGLVVRIHTKKLQILFLINALKQSLSIIPNQTFHKLLGNMQLEGWRAMEIQK